MEVIVKVSLKLKEVNETSYHTPGFLTYLLSQIKASFFSLPQMPLDLLFLSLIQAS